MSDFDDESTPPRPNRGSLRPLTDSERDAFRAQWASGVPSVADQDDREDTSPIDLFERAPRAASQDLVAKLRRHPERLIPFLGEFAEWVAKRMKERSSSEQDALEELRKLLAKPPNGRTAALEEHIKGLERTVTELVEAVEVIQEERKAEAEKAREEEKSANNRKWAAVGSIIVTLIGSAATVVATIRSASEAKGRADAENAILRRDVDELRAAAKHPSPHDYDWDIAPRPEPRHQKKDNEP